MHVELGGRAGDVHVLLEVRPQGVDEGRVLALVVLAQRGQRVLGEPDQLTRIVQLQQQPVDPEVGEADGAVGPVPSSWTGTWALPASFAVASLVQVIGSLVADGGGVTVLDRPHDPRDEVGAVWESRVQCAVCRRSYTAVEMDRDPSSGHGPICAEHAQSSRTFHAAAERESRGTVVPIRGRGKQARA